MAVNAHPAVEIKNTKESKHIELTDNDLEVAESSYGNLNWGRALGNFGGFGGHGLGGLGSFGSGK